MREAVLVHEEAFWLSAERPHGISQTSLIKICFSFDEATLDSFEFFRRDTYVLTFASTTNKPKLDRFCTVMLEKRLPVKTLAF